MLRPLLRADAGPSTRVRCVFIWKSQMPSLSRADVDKLLAQPSALLRAELAEKVGRDFDNQTLTASEVQIAQDIIRILAADIEATVRANLAQSLRCSNRLPHDVAVRLANDIDHVALPILTSSNLLTPDDLIEVVRGSSALQQQAIAGRRDLPEVVSDELIAQANVAAVTALMQNSSAHI